MPGDQTRWTPCPPPGRLPHCPGGPRAGWASAAWCGSGDSAQCSGEPLPASSPGMLSVSVIKGGETRLWRDRWSTGKSVCSAGASLSGFATDARQTNKQSRQENKQKTCHLDSPGLTFLIRKVENPFCPLP